MNRHFIYMIVIAAATIFLMLVGSGQSMDSDDIIRLKTAGVGDATIQLMVEEKTVETAAFTVDDIVSMRQAGIGDHTLQMLIRNGSFLRQRQPIVYGTRIRSIRFTTAADVIALKQAGLSDEVLQAIIQASRGADAVERENALEFLEDMNIRIDLRDDF